jgi:hypothetical protein
MKITIDKDYATKFNIGDIVIYLMEKNIYKSGKIHAITPIIKNNRCEIQYTIDCSYRWGETTESDFSHDVKEEKILFYPSDKKEGK